jgi:ketosteroid isomerase-like protein
MTPTRLFLPLLALGSACGRSPDLAPARRALEDADHAFNQATASRRTDGWMEFMAEDGALIRGAGTLQGQPAVRDAITKMFADTSFTLTWEPLQVDVGSGGDLGYTVGHWVARFRDAKGAPGSNTGRYLTVWKREADGSWKVVQDIGVQDVAPAAP